MFFSVYKYKVEIMVSNWCKGIYSNYWADFYTIEILLKSSFQWYNNCSFYSAGLTK